MAKFFGKLGFAYSIEEPKDSGIWVDKVEEFECYGDINRQVRRWESTQKVNDDININNEISI